MFVAVDVGNTNIVFGFYDSGILVQSLRIPTVRESNVTEILLYMSGPEWNFSITACAVGSVVPVLNNSLMDAIFERFGIPAKLLDYRSNLGFRVAYSPPEHTGTDRLMNTAATIANHGYPAVMVDFGTATTVDVVGPDKSYLGGAIIPGIRISEAALYRAAALLTPVELDVPPAPIGKNNTEALQSGIVLGYACMVDGLALKMQEEVGEPCTIVATGGLAGLVTRACNHIKTVDPNLTLDGIRIVYERTYV